MPHHLALSWCSLIFQIEAEMKLYVLSKVKFYLKCNVIKYLIVCCKYRFFHRSHIKVQFREFECHRRMEIELPPSSKSLPHRYAKSRYLSRAKLSDRIFIQPSAPVNVCSPSHSNTCYSNIIIYRHI